MAEALTYRVLELEERLRDKESQRASLAGATATRRMGDGAMEGGDRIGETAGRLARLERLGDHASAEHAPIQRLRALSPPLDL